MLQSAGHAVGHGLSRAGHAISSKSLRMEAFCRALCKTGSVAGVIVITGDARADVLSPRSAQ